jgi:DNA-binding transcriptional ArsR family regulator
MEIIMMHALTKPKLGPENVPHLAVAPLVQAVGDPLRWAILAELADGEPLMVKEIAERVRRKPSIVSKHLAVLRAAGAVVSGRGRLYQIPPHFRVAPDQRHVDFGHCLLRLPATEA